MQTGEVLALANYPSFDPSQRSKLTGPQLRNRALTDTFEPGSTMKPFIAAQALQTGRVRPDTLLPVGAAHHPDQWLHDQAMHTRASPVPRRRWPR